MLLALLLSVMMVQEEMRLMMVATLEMMKGMLDNNNNKVDNHWHLLVKMISHIILKMKTTTLEELVRVLEPLESHIEEDNEG